MFNGKIPTTPIIDSSGVEFDPTAERRRHYSREEIVARWNTCKKTKEKKRDVCLFWHNRASLFCWANKMELGIDMKHYREQVRKGDLVCYDYNNFDRADHDGRMWYSLTIQGGKGKLNATGKSPVNLFIFGYMVDGWGYYFKQRDNRDSIFRYLNDLPDDTYVRAKGNTDTYTNGDIPEANSDDEGYEESEEIERVLGKKLPNAKIIESVEIKPGMRLPTNEELKKNYTIEEAKRLFGYLFKD